MWNVIATVYCVYLSIRGKWTLQRHDYISHGTEEGYNGEPLGSSGSGYFLCACAFASGWDWWYTLYCIHQKRRSSRRRLFEEILCGLQRQPRAITADERNNSRSPDNENESRSTGKCRTLQLEVHIAKLKGKRGILYKDVTAKSCLSCVQQGSHPDPWLTDGRQS